MIYVWVFGNSGFYDNCNVDGYVISIYIIVIVSVSCGGYVVSYGEICFVILVVIYVSGWISIVVYVFLFCLFFFKKCIFYNICFF